MKRSLVVAHSEGDPRLVATVMRARVDREACRFFVLVPATPASTDYWTWTEDKARLLARRQLDAIMAADNAIDADIEGGIGDASPADAIDDMLRIGRFDEVLVVSPPATPARAPFTGLASSVRRLAATTFRTLRTAQPA
jgi:hypothetical protein